MEENFNNKKEKRDSFSPYNIFLGHLIEKICLTIIHWGTYLALFAPLVISTKFFFPFVAPKSLYFMGLAEIIFVAYVFLAISFPKYRPRINSLLLALVLFLIVSTLAAVFGVNPSESFWSKYERMGGLLTWLHLFIFFIATSSVFQKKDWLRVFGISIAVAISVNVLNFITLKEMGPLVNHGFDARGGATIGNSSFLGSHLIFNVFFALYLFLIATKKIKIFWGLIFAFLAVALYFSTARAAAISFAVGIILLFYLKLICIEKGKLRMAGIVLLIFSIISGTAIIFLSIQEGSVVQKVMIDKFSLSDRARALVWQIGWNGIKERPLLGWGPENFNIVFTKHFDSRIFLTEIYGGDIWYDRAHNIVIDTLATTGFIGLISYLGIFASAFYLLWKKYSSGKTDFLTAGIFSTILFAYFLQNLTVFDMISSYMMFFLALGFIGSITSQDSADSKEKLVSVKLWALPIVLVLFAFSFFYFIIQPVRANNYLIGAFGSTNYENRINLYKKSIETSPVGRFQVVETAAYRDAMKYSQQELAEQVPTEIQRAEFEFISQELENNIKEVPLLFSSYLALGKTYNLYGRIDASKFDRAEQVLEKSVEVSPANQQAYWVLAQTKLFKSKFDEAISLAEKAVDLEPRVERSSLILIQIAAIVGNITGDGNILMKEIEKVLKIDPSWATDIQAVLGQGTQ